MVRRASRYERRINRRLKAVSGSVTGGTPAGGNNQVQINNSGSFGASRNLTFEGNGLAVNMSGTNATHGITLPDSSTFEGQIKANAFVSYSSIRFKKDVQKLENAMDIITQLEGVSYKWKDTEKQDYGFIAEEVGRILPDIVEWEDEENATSIDYIKIISFLVEAVKYQHHKLNELEERVDNGSE
tara:strand:- start:2044 stop:2598 length:555 start_codon:yes stop_codon:yes gene_type:complete